MRPREQGRCLGVHRGRQQCPRGSRWGVGVPRGQGVKGEVRGVPGGQEGGPWGSKGIKGEVRDVPGGQEGGPWVPMGLRGTSGVSQGAKGIY